MKMVKIMEKKANKKEKTMRMVKSTVRNMEKKVKERLEKSKTTVMTDTEHILLRIWLSIGFLKYLS